MDNSKEMVKLAVNALEDKKGEDIQIIDIREVSVLADYFLIASVPIPIRYRPWPNMLKRPLARQGYVCRQVEGYQSGTDFNGLWRYYCPSILQRGSPLL